LNGTVTDQLHLDPDRLFPVDDRTRTIARSLYREVVDAPVISPHGHLDPSLFVADRAFSDPAELLIVHDHYITRLLHASGVPFGKLGREPHASTAREIWRAFAEHWHVFAGTASGYWMAHQLVDLFGVELTPSASTADAIFDAISQRLAQPEFRPRSLARRFGLEVLATTDDPLDDLAVHAMLAADDAFATRVLPTFRPDAYLDPAHPAFADNVERLLGVEGGNGFGGYLAALQARREHFIRHGAVSADHGVLQPYTVALDHDSASRLFDDARRGRLDEAGSREFAGHMLWQMARMSVDDGLVMTVHAGVHRNHSSATFERFGPDTGHDIPVATEFVANLHPLLESFGLDARLRLILFAVDETTFSREIAPLAGFYPSVLIGAPWWFLDAPDAVLRFRAATSETSGFYRGSGFIDDTRAFLSIPARHDMSRRLDAAHLAGLVAGGRVTGEQAASIMRDLVSDIPKKAFRL
jgi:glucuronate isomerase